LFFAGRLDDFCCEATGNAGLLVLSTEVERVGHFRAGAMSSWKIFVLNYFTLYAVVLTAPLDLSKSQQLWALIVKMVFPLNSITLLTIFRVGECHLGKLLR